MERPPHLHLVRDNPKPGRNDPCPCGSGKKYKKCHGSATATDPAPSVDELNLASNELSARLLRWGVDHIGREWLEPLLERSSDDPMIPFIVATMVYHLDSGKGIVAELARADRKINLTSEEREILTAERAAWFGVWEVTSLIPDRHIAVTDLLSGESRVVEERTAQQYLKPRDAVLAPVMEFRGVHRFAGIYPMAMPPIEAARIVEAMHRRLRRKSALPIERLKQPKHVRYLVDLWDDAAAERIASVGRIPELRNNDGDPIAFTEDHFVVQPADRGRLRELLATIPLLEPDDPDNPEEGYAFVSSTESDRPTLHGMLRPTESGLVLETNSVERADRLRRVLEEAAGEMLRHERRVDLPGPSLGGPVQTGAAPGPEEVPPEVVRELLEQHYRDWVVQPVPALGDITPREAVKTREGKIAVELLLKTFENVEDDAMMPRPDVGKIRRELGLH